METLVLNNMDKAIKVNLQDLARILMQVKTATPATFIAVTQVKMRKTDNPYHNKVYKKQKSNVFINFNYENSVNRALVKEGKEAEFEAKARAWGERLPGTPLVFHNGEYYLEARFLNAEPKIEYTCEGKPIEEALFERFVPEKNTGPSVHQGLEEQVVIRDFKLSNIHAITVNGNTYVRNDI